MGANATRKNLSKMSQFKLCFKDSQTNPQRSLIPSLPMMALCSNARTSTKKLNWSLNPLKIGHTLKRARIHKLVIFKKPQTDVMMTKTYHMHRHASPRMRPYSTLMSCLTKRYLWRRDSWNKWVNKERLAKVSRLILINFRSPVNSWWTHQISHKIQLP